MAEASTLKIPNQKKDKLQNEIFEQKLKIFFLYLDMEELRQNIEILKKENTKLKEENERLRKYIGKTKL